MMKERPPVESDGTSVRLSCCIPFCGRTYRNDRKETPWPKGQIIMCGKHWKTGPAALRERDKKLRRLLRKAERVVSIKGARRAKIYDRVAMWHNENWNRVRAHVTERAGGIG